MKFEDLSQNLNARIATIQVIALVLLAVLGVRLYYLQIVKGDQYAERAEEQRIRKLPIPAPRGAILDRNGKVLVDSRPTYNIILSRDALKKREVTSLIQPLAEGLDVDADVLQEQLETAKDSTAGGYESIVIKDNVKVSDITWVEAHNLEIPELRVELQPQRNYPLGKTLAHVLGYVGEISKKQLDDPKYAEQGLKSGDIIGKDGLEAAYDKILRGRDGYREVVVDSRSRIKEEIRVVPPQSGQDLVTTIDLTLQQTAEEQLANSATKRGVIIAMDPNNDEVLVLASSPSYDPNVFSRVNSKEGRKEIAALYNDPSKPLLNRAIRGRYYPGSTWKIPESVAALQQGVITTKESHIVCGGGIQVGNRFTRDTSGNHGTPDLPSAITHSCDGYYYRLALKMKPEGLIKMVEMFEYDKQTGIDLPAELISRTPKYFKPLKEKTGRWGDIDTVFASIGQVYVEVTPISMIRAVSSVGVGGKMFVPHLLKQANPIAAVGDEETPEYQPERPAILYDAPAPKIIEMTREQNDYVLKGMWGVVNNGGTAGRIKMANWEIAGKTGTAQNSAIGSGGAKDHAWFVSFAPAYKPEISVIGLIENSGFGAANAAPAVKGIYEAYLREKGVNIDENKPNERAIAKR
ncbi:MAG: penicillin-binding protein 2 [Pyrinomonadaceae bacterium]